MSHRPYKVWAKSISSFKRNIFGQKPSFQKFYFRRRRDFSFYQRFLFNDRFFCNIFSKLSRWYILIHLLSSYVTVSGGDLFVYLLFSARRPGSDFQTVYVPFMYHFAKMSIIWAKMSIFWGIDWSNGRPPF